VECERSLIPEAVRRSVADDRQNGRQGENKPVAEANAASMAEAAGSSS